MGSVRVRSAQDNYTREIDLSPQHGRHQKEDAVSQERN